MKKVYYLMHQYITTNGDLECKGLGIYSSMNELKNAKNRYSKKQGFSNHSGGFVYQSLVINEELWCDGYDMDDMGDTQYSIIE